MATPYDAIVIGAGVMGASIAFHLAREGLTNTLVLERGRVCSGNTAKSGALVRMHYSNVPEAALAVRSLRYFQNWREIVGGSCGFQQSGFLVLVGPENRDRLERNVCMQQAIGINTRVVETEDLSEVQPGLVADDGVSGAFEPDSGYADPVETTYWLIRSAHMLGVTILEETNVTAIRQQKGRVVGVDTNQGSFDAPAVMCAANVWSPALLRTVGVNLDLWPLRSQMAFVQRPEPLRDGGRVVLDLIRMGYFRPHAADNYLIGTPLADRQVTSAEDYDEQLDADYLELVRERISGRLPALAASPQVGGQAGLYDMSPDTRAILDEVPSVRGLFIAAGFSGSGFKISPMVGACMAELAAHGEARSADIQPFRFSRFAENDPIRGEHEYTLPASWGMKW